MRLYATVLLVVSLASPAAAQWSEPAQQLPAEPSVWDSQPAQPAAPSGPAGGSPWDRPAAPPQGAMGGSPWDRPAGPPQQSQACIAEFVKLREATEKRGEAVRAAGARKVTPKEGCAVLTAFTAAENKLVKYAIDNQQQCGIPPQFIDQMKKAQAQSSGVRSQVCKAAAAGPARPQGPTLSDTLTAPVPSADNIKTGRGTFDTLTGAPLGR